MSNFDFRFSNGPAPCSFPPVGIVETLEYLCWFYGIDSEAGDQKSDGGAR